MARKKHIGIIMGRIYKKLNKRLLSGILEQARLLGYSTMIFTLNEECYNEKVKSGEKNLFHAISFSQLDGIVYAPYTFASGDFQRYIDRFLTENCMKPVVRIGIEADKGIPVWYDDKSEMAEITLHLIYGHGCRNLLCLTGPAENAVSLSRAAGFKEAMQSAGLPVSEDAVIYGDFWIHTAQKLADEFADGIRPMPDAVVCANDNMAIALCDALTAHHIAVPEQILVTGYDGFTEARLHVPAITTYHPSQEMLGRRAMCRLFEAMTGEIIQPNKTEKGILMRRESCGCNSQNENISSQVYDEIMAEEGILDCSVSAAFYEAETLNALILRMFEMQYKFMHPSRFDTERLYLCLCDDWDSRMLTDGGNAYRTAGYSDTMYLVGSEGSKLTFSQEQMLPVSLDKESITAAFFLPVHFQDQCFGYIALEVNDCIDDFNMDYIRFCREVNNALKFLCTQNELKRLLYREKLAQSRDDLTGLYLFTNCKDMWKEIQDSAAVNKEQIYLIVVSAGGLRQIENAAGSVESDRYLAAFADVLARCCNGKEKIFKVNQKSFVIVSSCHEPEKRTQDYLQQIKEVAWNQSVAEEKKHMVYAKTETKILPAGTIISADTVESEIQQMLDKINESTQNQISEYLHYSELLALRREIFLYPETEWNGDLCCKQLNISKSYFHKIYTRVFGVTFMQDVQKSRLNRAKKLLLTTSLLLPDIAEQCGYDYYNFMRVFKKEEGMTPTQYRKTKQ